MKEIRDIVRLFELHLGDSFALATLVRAKGSSYRRPGARMLMWNADLQSVRLAGLKLAESSSADNMSAGRTGNMPVFRGSACMTAGSLSGGCLEEEVARCAMEVIQTGIPSLMSFDTRLRFGCNGSIDVFVEAVRGDFLSELATNFLERRRSRVVTVFAGEDLGTRLVRHDAIVPADAFVQEIEPAIRLLIFGEGPDSLPLRTFAEILGWEVFEIEQPADLANHFDHRTAAVIKSHNYGRDFAALCQLLKLDLHYVGLLGPRKRRDQLLHAVLDEGIAIDAEVFAPAGLDLGAETPEELALALVSEIQATFAGATAASLRNRKAPIHGWNIVPQPAPVAAEECPTSPA